MKIFLDGQECSLVDTTNKSLAAIIEAMGLKIGHLAIRINQKYIPPIRSHSPYFEHRWQCRIS